MMRYYYDNHGMEYAEYTGKQDKNIRLGFVVDKEMKLFWSPDEWFYVFDVDTEKHVEPEASMVDWKWVFENSLYPVPSKKIVFGDSYFLHEFMKVISYDSVIASLECKRLDCLYAMIHYYALNSMEFMEQNPVLSPSEWYIGNYARYLFPKANFSWQTILKTFSDIGKKPSLDAFFKAHVNSILGIAKDNECILYVGQSIQTKSDRNFWFTPIVGYHKESKLPLFYKLIFNDNVSDGDILGARAQAMLYGLKVAHVVADCRNRSVPDGVQHLMDLNLDFTAIIDTTLDLLERIDFENPSLGSSFEFQGKTISCWKAEDKLGSQTETGKDIHGFWYVYQYATKKKIQPLKRLERYGEKGFPIADKAESCGVFSLVSSVDCPGRKIIEDYAIANNSSTFFQFAKDYHMLLKDSKRGMKIFQGYMLVSFIAFYLIILIQRRLNTVSRRYLQPLDAMDKAIDDIIVTQADGQTQCFICTEPLAYNEPIIFQEFFLALKNYIATLDSKGIHPVHEKKRGTIAMLKQLEALGIGVVNTVSLTDNVIEPKFRKEYSRKLDWRILASNEPMLSDDEIDKLRESMKHLGNEMDEMI